MSTISGRVDEDVLVLPTRMGAIAVYPRSYQASLNDQPVQLTRLEFLLLKFLAENPSAVFSRKQLLDSVWGVVRGEKTRTVDVFISRLRHKFGAPGNAVFRTVPRVGYGLVSIA